MESEPEFIELRASRSYLEEIKVGLLLFMAVLLVWIGTEVHHLNQHRSRAQGSAGQMVVNY